MASQACQLIQVIAGREDFRDRYGERKDPILSDRLLWRAQTFRHMVHLLPGETILELGAGRGHLISQLRRVTRGENPITAVTFGQAQPPADQQFPDVEWLHADQLPGALEGRRFDCIIGRDLLDERNCAWLLQQIYALLAPGGKVILYESNPWNAILNIRRRLAKWTGASDTRRLLSRPRIYEMMSEIGFIKILAIYNDFVYAPLNRPLIWLLRNASIVLENMPGVQSLAGSILLSCQKSGAPAAERPVCLSEHRQLHGAISVVIPCHNEEMNVERIVRRLCDLYGAYLHEIILVEDNSEDDTAAVIRRLAAEMPLVRPVFRRPPNGVGRALRDGYLAASGKYVLSLDCDFAHLLPELRDLFDAAAAGYDVVVGSRFSRHSVLLNYPFSKILANRTFHVLAQIAFHRPFRDLTNNLKLIRREVVEQVDLTAPGFAVNAETGLRPLLMGYSVCEVPISWINRTPDMGMSSFRLAKVGGGYWRVLARLAVETRFGFRRLKPAPRSLEMVRAEGFSPDS